MAPPADIKITLEGPMGSGHHKLSRMLEQHLKGMGFSVEAHRSGTDNEILILKAAFYTLARLP